MAQVSGPVLERERRRSIAIQRKSMAVSRKDQLLNTVFGKPETDPKNPAEPWLAQHDETLEHLTDHDHASFLVRADKKPRDTVRIHPDSFARTSWDLLMFLTIVTVIIVDPIRSGLCANAGCVPPVELATDTASTYIPATALPLQRSRRPSGLTS